MLCVSQIFLIILDREKFLYTDAFPIMNSREKSVTVQEEYQHFAFSELNSLRSIGTETTQGCILPGQPSLG